MLADFISFLIKLLVRVISEHYDRSVKETLSEPTRRFPHTRVSSNIHLSPATRGASTQQDLPDKNKVKDSKDMQGLFGLLVFAFA